MNEFLIALFELGPQLSAHILLSASAIFLAIIFALPLGLIAGSSPTFSRVVLGLASAVQTIPALALLALFFPILLSLRLVFGEGLPTLGFLPALLALSIYALLPILRNTVTARSNLDTAALEAADAIGMTKGQKLVLIEVPLMAPFVMAGIRTSSVWTIGTATLATTIGQPSLGDPIFAGLQTQNWTLVLAGCSLSAALALLTDFFLSLVESGMRNRSKTALLSGLAAVVISVSTAFAAQYSQPVRAPVIIGAKGFSEQYILARLIGQRLQANGFAIEYRDGLGSAVAHSALSSNDIDLLIDYTGTVWTNQMKRSDNPSRDRMYEEISVWEAKNSGALVLGRLGFENAYGLAVTEAFSRQFGATSIADIVSMAPKLTIGGDPEFFERPEWTSVRDSYALRFGAHRNFSPTFMYNALKAGEVDVISAYTSDGRIVADDLIVLEDPNNAFPNYDAILLLSPDNSENENLVSTLEPVLGRIGVDAIREANYSVDRERDKLTPNQAAQFLAQKVGL